MRLVILGATGSGRGTQSELLCQRLDIKAISTGDMLREAIEAQTELGQQVQPYVMKGELAPDEIMIALIRERIQLPDVAAGWILDGHPRTAFQAEELDFLLDDLNQSLNWVLWLEVPEEVLIQRSLERSREDDQVEVVKRRIQLFHERTLPMLEYYEARGRLLKVDGSQSKETVHQTIVTGLGLSH